MSRLKILHDLEIRKMRPAQHVPSTCSQKQQRGVWAAPLVADERVWIWSPSPCVFPPRGQRSRVPTVLVQLLLGAPARWNGTSSSISKCAPMRTAGAAPRASFRLGSRTPRGPYGGQRVLALSTPMALSHRVAPCSLQRIVTILKRQESEAGVVAPNGSAADRLPSAPPKLPCAATAVCAQSAWLATCRGLSVTSNLGASVRIGCGPRQQLGN